MTNIVVIQQTPKIKTYDLTGAMMLVKEIEIQLRGQPSQWAFGKLNAIAHNAPYSMILKEVQEDIRDNYSAVAQMLGVDLTERIKNF